MAANSRWHGLRLALVATGGGFKVAFSVGVLIALHGAGMAFDYILGTSGTAIAFAEYIASGSRTAGLVRTFREIERIGPKALFNKVHMIRDILLDELEDNHHVWRTIVKTAWRFMEAAFLNDVLRNGLPPTIDGIRSLADRIDVKGLTAAETEFDIAVHRRARKGRADCHTLVGNHDERFKKNPEAILDEIVGSASFLPFIRNRKRFDGLYFGNGLRVALRKADIVFVLVNDQPRADERRGFFPDFMKAFGTMYDIAFFDEVVKVYAKNPALTVWTGGSIVPYIRKIGLMARFGKRYGLSKRCIVFITPKMLIGALTTIDFNAGDITRAMDHGHACGTEVLVELKKMLEANNAVA
ncbi:MAG: patatin-like phospholipase family protein [bacterium]|nr:patatin-like phospholipase family protein [bacterium]